MPKGGRVGAIPFFLDDPFQAGDVCSIEVMVDGSENQEDWPFSIRLRAVEETGSGHLFMGGTIANIYMNRKAAEDLARKLSGVLK